MKHYRILNLGAGVQSSAIYCLMADGEVEPADYALFSDTQDEPKWVYEQLEWLRQNVTGPEIVTVTAGRIGDHVMAGENSTGQKYVTIPAHTTYREGEKGGLVRRQCTREYKIAPIDQWIRRSLLGLKPKQRIPKDVCITNAFGFSTDEPQRAVKMRVQYERRGVAWACEFPLFDDEIMMSRRDCQRYIEHLTGFEWRSSRCVFCPLQGNPHWREIKEHDPTGWKRAIEVDASLRSGAVLNRNEDQVMYAHKSFIPLEKANLDEGQGVLFEDDGGCDQGCFL